MEQTEEMQGDGKGPKLPVFLVGDDNATLLAHFKVTPPIEQLIREYIARRGWTLRRFADACIGAYLEVRAQLHGEGERLLYEAAPRSASALGIFATRSAVLKLQAWADFDDHEHRAAYYTAAQLYLRALHHQGALALDEAQRAALCVDSRALNERALLVALDLRLDEVAVSL